MAERRIVNLDAAELRDSGDGQAFAARIAKLGQMVGSTGLGCTLTVLAPGKRAWPFHRHHVIEELFYVLEGAGEVRLDDARLPIRAGDLIASPAGKEAHQIVNTSDADLKYLGVSTRLSPDIAEYPDTGRFGILAEFPPGPDGKPGGLRFIGRAGESGLYWDGE